MEIAFSCSEYFGVKDQRRYNPTTVHGGFGFVTRKKAEYMAKNGHEVHAFIPAYSYDKQQNRNKDFELNGVQIHLYKDVDFSELSRITILKRMLFTHENQALAKKLKEYKVEIFDTEEPQVTTSQINKLTQKNIVVFQDPWDYIDISTLRIAYINYSQLPYNKINNDIFQYRLANYIASDISYKLQIRQIWKALKMLPKNQIFAEANFISKKVNKMYRLNFIPSKLPNPVDIQKSIRVHKSDNPSIVWLGRWDPQKRVDIALDVASKMKGIDFYFIGTATDVYNFVKVETYLRKLYQNFSNIHILGFITEEEKIAYLSKAWGLLNTSVREGLPVSFLEALAYETPLISYVDPDNYVSAFGIKSKDLTVESYINAINKVVYNELYKTKGKAGRHFVEKEHETTIVMKKHISIYNKVLNS